MTSVTHAISDLDQAYSVAPQARSTGSQAPLLAPSRKALWTGRIVSGFAILFLAMDAVMKLVMAPAAVKGTSELGYPTSVIFTLGLIQLACLAAYLVPRTAVLGAILWTGYLGGAIATHVRVENPLFSHVLFPVYVALMLWGGLWLRDLRLRALLPLR
jgi:hypothetical protein